MPNDVAEFSSQQNLLESVRRPFLKLHFDPGPLAIVLHIYLFYSILYLSAFLRFFKGDLFQSTVGCVAIILSVMHYTRGVEKANHFVLWCVSFVIS